MVPITRKFPVRAATLHPFLRLEKEIEVLENAGLPPAITKEKAATPSPAKEAQKEEVVLNSRQVRSFLGPHPCCGQILDPFALESQLAIS